MDTPRGPRAPQGSHGHRSLWDLLGNRENEGGTHPNPAVMDLSAQGWSWVGSGDTSDFPVSRGGIQVSISQGQAGQAGPGGLQESQGPGLGCRAGRGSVGHSTTVLSTPGSFQDCPLLQARPSASTPRGVPQPGIPRGIQELHRDPRSQGGAEQSRAASHKQLKDKIQPQNPAGSQAELGPARREPWHLGGVTSSPGRAQRAPSRRPAWPGGWASPWAS